MRHNSTTPGARKKPPERAFGNFIPGKLNKSEKYRRRRHFRRFDAGRQFDARAPVASRRHKAIIKL
jgi:hypothetical protein